MQKFTLLEFKKKDSQSTKPGKFSRFKRLPFLNLIYVSLLLNAISVASIFILKKYLPPEVPFFYGLPEGEEQLAANVGLVIAPLISLVIVTINVILALVINSELLRKTLIITGFCVTIFSLITLAQIVFLVGSF